MDSEWLRGAMGAREGIFPASFVEIVVPFPDAPPAASAPAPTAAPSTVAATVAAPAAAAASSTPTRPGKALVLYDYDATADDELPLIAGKTVELIAVVDSEWFRARLRDGREGLCPRVFLDVLEEPGDGGSAENQPHAVAEFDYDSTEAGDLTFRTGEVISLLQKLDGGWYQGRLDAREGIFPAAFVKVVVDC